MTRVELCHCCGKDPIDRRSARGNCEYCYMNCGVEQCSRGIAESEFEAYRMKILGEKTCETCGGTGRVQRDPANTR